ELVRGRKSLPRRQLAPILAFRCTSGIFKDRLSARQHCYVSLGQLCRYELHGNGLQDFRALNRNYNSVLSVPDITWNHAPALNYNIRHDVTSNFSLSGNAYFRFLRADTNNGDINDDSLDQSLYNLSNADINALHAAGYTGFPTTGNSTTEPFPFWR